MGKYSAVSGRRIIFASYVTPLA